MAARYAVTVRDLFKSYSDDRHQVHAVRGVSFEVQEGEFYTLLGPSGCGKTTTLRCVAGLERTDSGRIVVHDRIVSSHQPTTFVPPHKRDIGMVFQSYAIWPHMTVFENVAFPLRVSSQRVNGADIKRRVDQTLLLVQLDGYGSRPATQLSGGQQQRLALARAIVREPRLLLLDEPLSNLDAKLREDMRAELRELQRRLGLTTIYVTHDQIEALGMSNRIALMSAGRIMQEGPPRELYQRPATPFVASFLGSTNLLEAEVLGRDESLWTLQTRVGQLLATCPPRIQRGDKVTVSIRPESLTIHSHSPGSANVLPGEVETSMFMGETAECRVRVGGMLLRGRQHPNVSFTHGERVFVQLPPECCTVISDEHGVAAPEYRGEVSADDSLLRADPHR